MIERVRPTLSPDHAARRVIVAAYCYYVLDDPVMTDGEYDALSNYVADHWDELDPDRQWALDTPRQTRMTGHHIFFSTAAVHAAHHHLARFGRHHRLPSRWKYSKRQRTDYVTAA